MEDSDKSVDQSSPERELHAQKLATLGMLAGGVAHDFNNILAGILGHVTYLKTILPQKGAHVESLNAIEEGGRKASVMTQQILNFSRFESAEKPSRVNLNELVTRTCSLLRGAISRAYSLEQQLLDPAPCVLASEGGLAQVLVNLVINSRDALAETGVIRVELGTEDEVAKLCRVFATKELAARRYVSLSVKDNGSGMSAETMARMFEPYFSTKKDKGTGLGLAIVRSIVASYGGAIDVRSQVGRGTAISIYLPEAELPKVPEVARDQAAPSRPPRLEGGDESILVVDDEFPVRNVLSVSLQHLGYRVECAESGMEALDKFARASSGFDLVVLDMLMPQLSGEKVFFKLKELQPQVRVLLISGYSSEESVRNVLAHGGIDFIQKPFTIEELSRKVRQCLDKDLGRSST